MNRRCRADEPVDVEDLQHGLRVSLQCASGARSVSTAGSQRGVAAQAPQLSGQLRRLVEQHLQNHLAATATARHPGDRKPTVAARCGNSGDRCGFVALSDAAGPGLSECGAPARISSAPVYGRADLRRSRHVCHRLLGDHERTRRPLGNAIGCRQARIAAGHPSATGGEAVPSHRV